MGIDAVHATPVTDNSSNSPAKTTQVVPLPDDELPMQHSLSHPLEEEDDENLPYDVTRFYWEDEIGSPVLGRYAAKLATNEVFVQITLGVIALNAIWIGIDTDHNDAPDISSAKPLFVIGENLFCVFFSFELLVRFLSFKVKRNCLKDNWFKFDGALVALMIFETWIVLLMSGGGGMSQLSLLRMLRLLRLTRMARLMRSMPELLTLIKGMVAATRSVFSSLVLLVICLYVFAIIFTQEYRDADTRLEDDPSMPNMFGSMGNSMLTLFVNGTLLDNLLGVMVWLRDDNQLLMWVFSIFVLLSAFTVLNMLIGVLCEVIDATAAAEQEAAVQADAHFKLKEVFIEIDVDKSGLVSEKEFEQMLENPSAVACLKQMGIEKHVLKDLAETLFMDLNEGSPTEPARKNAWDGDSPIHRSPSKDATGLGNMSPTSSPSTVIRRNEAGKVELNFPDFLERLSHLKPGTQANVLDFADLQKQLNIFSARAQRTASSIKRCLDDLEVKMGKTGALLPEPDDPQPQVKDVVVKRPPANSGRMERDLSSVSTETLLQEVGRRMARGGFGNP